MVDFQPPGSAPQEEEFLEKAKMIINSSEEASKKSTALKSLIQSMNDYLNNLDITRKLESLQAMLLKEEEFEEDKKSMVREVNEQLQKKSEEYVRKRDKEFQKEILKEIEAAAKEEAPKPSETVDSEPERVENNELDEFESEIDKFLERNKDDFRYTQQNQESIKKLNDFIQKFNESPNLKFASSGRNLEQLREQVQRIGTKVNQFKEICDSTNGEKRLSQLDSEYRRLESRVETDTSEQAKEALTKEIQLNRLKREHVLVELDVKQNLEERMRNFKGFQLNPDFNQQNDTGVINSDNFYAYEQALLKHFDMRDGEFVSTGWSGAYEVESGNLETKNLFSSESLIESLQKEIPKLSIEETDESYMQRINEMPLETMDANARGILKLYNEVASEERKEKELLGQMNEQPTPEPEPSTTSAQEQIIDPKLLGKYETQLKSLEESLGIPRDQLIAELNASAKNTLQDSRESIPQNEGESDKDYFTRINSTVSGPGQGMTMLSVQGQTLMLDSNDIKNLNSSAPSPVSVPAEPKTEASSAKQESLVNPKLLESQQNQDNLERIERVFKASKPQVMEALNAKAQDFLDFQRETNPQNANETDQQYMRRMLSDLGKENLTLTVYGQEFKLNTADLVAENSQEARSETAPTPKPPEPAPTKSADDLEEQEAVAEQKVERKAELKEAIEEEKREEKKEEKKEEQKQEQQATQAEAFKPFQPTLANSLQALQHPVIKIEEERHERQEKLEQERSMGQSPRSSPPSSA